MSIQVDSQVKELTRKLLASGRVYTSEEKAKMKARASS